MANFGNLYDYISSRGIAIPQTSDIKAKVEQAFKEIFGADFSVAPETTNGRLIEAVTLMFVDVCGVGAQIANAMNIQQAVGSFIDGLGALWNVSRLAGEGDTAYRKRIIESASRGSGFAQSVENAVGSVEGVEGVVVLDNGLEDPNALPKTPSGEAAPHSIAVAGHSIFVCVLGGDSEDVAEAILRNKSMGCSMDASAEYGTLVTQTVTIGGSSLTAYFHRPVQRYVWLDITVNPIAYTGDSIVSDTQAAVRALLNDNKINATTTKAQIVAAIAALGSGIVATGVTIRVNSQNSESTSTKAESLIVKPYMFIDPENTVIRVSAV